MAALAAAILLCAVLRGWIITKSEVISRDGIYYVQTARAWARDPIQCCRQERTHPGYPAAMAAGQWVLCRLGVPEGLRSWELAGQAVSLISAMGACAAVFLLGRLATGWAVGLTAVLLAAVCRKWAYLGADVLSDSLAVCLALWAIWLALAARRGLEDRPARGLTLAALAGLAAGLAFLVRPEAVLVLPAGLAAWHARPRPGPAGRVWTACGLALLTAGAAILPYVLIAGRLTNKTNLFDAIGTGVSAWPALAIIPANLNWPALMPALDDLVDLFFEAQHPLPAFLTVGFLLLANLRRLRCLREPLASFPRLSHPYGVAGSVLLLLYVPLFMANRILVGVSSYRYLILPALLLMPLAAGMLVFLAGRLASLMTPAGPSRRRRVFAAAAVVAVIAALAADAFRPPHQGKEVYRQAGEFLSGRITPGTNLFTDNPWIVYYSGGQGVMWPHSLDLATLVNQIHDTTAHVLALSDPIVRTGDGSLSRARQIPGLTEITHLVSATRRSEGARIFTIDQMAFHQAMGWKWPLQASEIEAKLDALARKGAK